MIDHCIGAAEKDAIDVLMVTDSLFRSQSLTERKKYVALVEKVRSLPPVVCECLSGPIAGSVSLMEVVKPQDPECLTVGAHHSCAFPPPL